MAELQGVVAKIGPKFGFIHVDGVADEVFLSLSELPAGAEVRRGTQVVFELTESRKGLRAVNVRILETWVPDFASRAAAVIERARGELDGLAREYGIGA